MTAEIPRAPGTVVASHSKVRLASRLTCLTVTAGLSSLVLCGTAEHGRSPITSRAKKQISAEYRSAQVALRR